MYLIEEEGWGRKEQTKLLVLHSFSSRERYDLQCYDRSSVRSTTARPNKPDRIYVTPLWLKRGYLIKNFLIKRAFCEFCRRLVGIEGAGGCAEVSVVSTVP